MLPHNLNKFKEYLDTHISYDYEEMGNLLKILNDRKIRSQFYSAIEKVGTIAAGKPTVEVKEYITTEGRYIQEKIVITSYYKDHTQQYAIRRCIQNLKETLSYDDFVFDEEYKPPYKRVMDGAKISG